MQSSFPSFALKWGYSAGLDGGYSHWHGSLPFGALFADFGIHDGGGVSSQMKEPYIHKLGAFIHNGKKHSILPKFGVFCTKLVCWWVVNTDKIRYSESQNFEVRQAHPRRKFFEVPPPRHDRYLDLNVFISVVYRLNMPYVIPYFGQNAFLQNARVQEFCKSLIPRLTKGVVATPLTVFPGRSKTQRKLPRAYR